MNSQRLMRKLTRREFLQATAAATAMSMGGPLAHAQSGPWGQRPPSEVDVVNFVVWSYGRIYEDIAAKFTEDWKVPVEPTISPSGQHEAKFTTMFAGGETIDVAVSQPAFFAGLV